MKKEVYFSFISLVSISLLSACSNNAKYSDLCKVYLENLRSADYIDNIDVSLELQDVMLKGNLEIRFCMFQIN